jgi:hypothetical protein
MYDPDLSNSRLFYALHIKSDIIFGISLYNVTTKWLLCLVQARGVQFE